MQETAVKFGMDEQKVNTALAKCHQILFQERQRRPRPHLDDKMVAAWNGECILSLQTCKDYDRDDDYFSFLFSHILQLLHSSKNNFITKNSECLCLWEEIVFLQDLKYFCGFVSAGLMVSGMARGGQVLGDATLTARAIKAAEFLKTYLFIEESNTLLRSCYAGMEGIVTQL